MVLMAKLSRQTFYHLGQLQGRNTSASFVSVTGEIMALETL